MRPRLGLGLAIVLAGCLGPKPEVESVQVSRAEASRVIVTVAVRNRGRGEGQAVVEVTLRDRASGTVVAREEVGVDLHAYERITLSRELVVSRTGDVVAEAVARYPP